MFNFGTAEFPYADIEDDTFAGLRIDSIAGGVLWVDSNDDNVLNNDETALESGTKRD